MKRVLFDCSLGASVVISKSDQGVDRVKPQVPVIIGLTEGVADSRLASPKLFLMKG